MEEEKKTYPAEENKPMPRIRSEYSHLFEDNDEDPYEQIFRRVEDQKEETVGGMPADKDVAVAGLFAEPEQLPETPDMSKAKVPRQRKKKTLGAQIAELLQKLPRKTQKPEPQTEKAAEEPIAVETVRIAPEEETTETPIQETTVAEVPVQPAASAPEAAPEVRDNKSAEEKDYLPAELVEEKAPVFAFGRKKPKKTEELPETPAPAEEATAAQPVPETEAPLTHITDAPKEIPVVGEADDGDDEPVIVFAPIGVNQPEAEMPVQYTVDAPKEIPVMEDVDDGDDEPVIVFAPIGVNQPEPEVLMSHTADAPKEIPVMEAADGAEGEPVIVFAPIGANQPEPEVLMSHTGDIPKFIPVVETRSESVGKQAVAFAPVDAEQAEMSVPMTDAEKVQKHIPVTEAVDDGDDEPVIVFAPIDVAQPEEDAQMFPAEETQEEMRPTEPEHAEEPATAMDEERSEVPADPPAWNVKVDIPEEIKDVEGKLKIVTVEDLPIHIFTEAQQELVEPAAPEIPVPDFDQPEQDETGADTPEEKKPEEPAEVPQDTPAETEPSEQPQEPVQPEEPPQPICVQWSEETFRPYRGKEIRVISHERMYGPVEKEYQRMVAPGRKKKKQERLRRKRQEAMQLLKEAAAEKAVRTRDCVTACAKKTAHNLHPKVVYGRIRNVAVSTAETGTYNISAMVQLIAAGLAGLVLLALLMINKYNISLQVELSQYKVPVLFATIHAVAVGTALLLSFRTMVGGTVSLFTRRCDRGTDGMMSLLMWFCLTQSVLSIFFCKEIVQGTVSLYAPIGMLVLFMDAWGKLLNHQRVRRAVKLLDSTPDAESAGVLMEDTELQARVDASVPDRLTVVRLPAADREAFIRNAVQRDGSQKVIRLMTGPLLLAAVLVGLLEYSVSGSWMTALAACTAVLCVSAPLSMTMCMTVPALRGGKRMSKAGAAAASWDAAANFGEVGCVVVRDEDLFPAAAMKLINVKVIRERLLETAVVSAAAVLHRTGGPLRSVFDRILTGEVASMPQAERVHVEENGGVVGWVNGLRIIIGKGETLRKYNIQPPSRDYENKNCPEGKQFVYLAAGGELVAMFVLEYGIDPAIRQTLQTLSNTGCDLAVNTADINLSQTFLMEEFDLEADGVELLADPGAPMDISAEEDTQNQLILQRGSESLFAALTTCIRMKGAMELASALQFAGVLLGILLIVVFSATGAIYQLSNLVIGLFKLFWLTAVLLIPALRRM